MTDAIRAEGLGKRFGTTVALDGVDLAVPVGTVCGLLGPNGAGKTTAVRVLTTLTKPDSGRAEVAGFDVAREPGQVRRHIGLTGQQTTVDDILTGRENLTLWGRLFHLSPRAAARRADGLLEQFALRDAADVPAAAAVLARVTGVDPEVDTLVRRVGAPVRDRAHALTEVVRALDAAGLEVEDIGVRRPTLDEVFLQLTGKPARDLEGARS